MGYTVISAPHRAAPFHRFRHCTLFELLTQQPNHTIAATTPHPLNASALSQSAVMPVSHGTFQPCAGMSVASVSLSIGRSQPNNYSVCRFHTAHRQAPCSGLTLPWCRNAVAYMWQGRLGIEPTQAVLETASPALEHSPLYPAFTDSSRSLLRVLSNARFNAGKSNGPSRSHALLTGQIWTHPAGNGFPALSPCTLSALGLGADGWTRTSDQWHSIAYPFAR